MDMKILGMILIGIGVLVFAYKGVTYKTVEKVVDLGAIQITQEKTKTFPFSPVFGGAALVGGILLVGFSGKRVG